MTRVEVRRIAEGEGGSNVHGSKKVRFEKGVSEGRRGYLESLAVHGWRIIGREEGR